MSHMYYVQRGWGVRSRETEALYGAGTAEKTPGGRRKAVTHLAGPICPVRHGFVVSVTGVQDTWSPPQLVQPTK